MKCYFCLRQLQVLAACNPLVALAVVLALALALAVVLALALALAMVLALALAQ